MKKFLAPIALFFFLLAEQAQAVALFPGETIAGYREYVRAFYAFSIPVGLLIATVLIMIGGVIWITSAGDQGRIAKAKEFIIQPIIGVIILAGAYTLLAVINPNLVDLRLQIATLSNIEGGSCQLINPSTYKNQPESIRQSRCLQGCVSATSKEDCDSTAESRRAGAKIYTPDKNCNTVCAQKEQVIPCSETPPFSTASVSLCNRGCFDKGGPRCRGQALTRATPDARLGMCTCHEGPPLEASTAAEQQREADIRQVQQARTEDPYQRAAILCGNQSGTLDENSDASFSDGEVFWLDNCNDLCSGAAGADGTFPDPNDSSQTVRRACRVDEGSSSCTLWGGRNAFVPDEVEGCYIASCACGLYNPALHAITGS